MQDSLMTNLAGRARFFYENIWHDGQDSFSSWEIQIWHDGQDSFSSWEIQIWHDGQDPFTKKFGTTGKIHFLLDFSLNSLTKKFGTQIFSLKNLECPLQIWISQEEKNLARRAQFFRKRILPVVPNLDLPSRKRIFLVVPNLDLPRRKRILPVVPNFFVKESCPSCQT